MRERSRVEACRSSLLRAYRRLTYGIVMFLVMLWIGLLQILENLDLDDFSIGIVFFAGLVSVIFVYMGLDEIAVMRARQECS